MAEDGFAMGYALGQDSGGSNNNGGGFGGWGDGIWAVIILAILFGNGGFGGGFGGFGGGNGGGNMSAGFAWQGIDNGIRGVQQGICDATFALNNTIVPYKNEPEDTSIDGFKLISHETISYTLKLDTEGDVRALFMMTPYAYRTSREDRERVLSLSEVTTEVEFIIDVYEKI